MFQLDLTNDEVSSGFSALPAGKYDVVCDTSEIKATKDGTGEYFNVAFKVTGGEFDGRKIFTMFNFKNKNAEAVTIGRKQLKEFMLAAGRKEFILNSAHDLIGLKANVMVKIKTDEYGEKNTISYYKPVLNDVRNDLGVPF